MHGLRGQFNTTQGITEVNDQEKRLHTKKSNRVIPFDFLFYKY